MILGNGSPQQASWFLEDYPIEATVLVDHERAAYRIVGAKRPRIAGVRTLAAAWRAFRKGFRQSGTKGDALQLGGVFVLTPEQKMPYLYVSRFAGDHPDPAESVRKIEALAAG